MNWITTNIRFPEDLYMELKHEAARERKSIAAVIREKLSEREKSGDKKEAKELLRKLKKLSHKIAVENKGINLTQAVIDARYSK